MRLGKAEVEPATQGRIEKTGLGSDQGEMSMSRAMLSHDGRGMPEAEL